MINNRVDSYDHESYRMLPVEDRWLLNKLMVADKLGYACGPVGEPPPEGVYCVRPIMSLTGNGNPGFFKWTVGPGGQQNDLVAPMPGGYMWSEWVTGEMYGFDFRDDQLVKATKSVGTNEDDLIDILPTNETIAMPSWLQGKMRYLSITTIGDRIIEINPRWQWEMSAMRRVPNTDGSYRWEHVNAGPPIEV